MLEYLQLDFYRQAIEEVKHARPEAIWASMDLKLVGEQPSWPELVASYQAREIPVTSISMMYKRNPCMSAEPAALEPEEGRADSLQLHLGRMLRPLG